MIHYTGVFAPTPRIAHAVRRIYRTLAQVRQSHRHVAHDRSRAEGNIADALMAQYYGQAPRRLIITEGTSPSPNGWVIRGFLDCSIRLMYRAGECDLRGSHQGRQIFVQLMHTGRVGHVANLPPVRK